MKKDELIREVRKLKRQLTAAQHAFSQSSAHYEWLNDIVTERLTTQERRLAIKNLRSIFKLLGEVFEDEGIVV